MSAVADDHLHCHALLRRRFITVVAVAQLPSGQRQAVPYALATGPPFLLALAFPALFFSALDFAGCYGVLTLFGLLPVAMAWSERYEVSGHRFKARVRMRSRTWLYSGWLRIMVSECCEAG